MKQFILLFTLGSLMITCSKEEDQPRIDLVVEDSFQSGANGWQAGFAEYTAGEESRFELDSGIMSLPSPLNQNSNGYYISGRNLSDDLFMYLSKEITGLASNATYTATFSIDIASNAPSGMAGIGGAPGESVHLGIGVVTEKPVTMSEDGTIEINIEKGNQATGGPDREVIGNIANGTSESNYVMINRQGSVTFSTGSNGTVWVMVSTDSGFEGKTSIYYSRIRIEFSRH